MPDELHALSVALPRWTDVVAYEEKDPSCRKALQAIYPRFGFHPLVAKFSEAVLKESPDQGCTAWPFANEQAADLARNHCQRCQPNALTMVSIHQGIACLVTNANAAASEFWQHTGLGASSRQVATALGQEHLPSTEAGQEAKITLLQRLASLYETDPGSVTLVPSGMAALHSALQAITALWPGHHTLQLGFPYVDVLKLPQIVFAGGDLLLRTDANQLQDYLDDHKPAAVIIEVPSNPMLQCVDLIRVAQLAHARGIAVIADDTIGSVLNIDLLKHVDMVFSSLTKSFAGRGDIMAGGLVVSPYSQWSTALKHQLNQCKAELFISDTIELEKASRDVQERVPKLNRNCQILAEHLSKHPAVLRVMHPENCNNFRALMRPNAGFGCLLSFELKNGETSAKKVYDHLRVCKGPSLGTDFTLVCPYVLLAHYHELEWAESCDVPKHLLRVSVGLEDPDDLWDRFQAALES